MRSIRRIPVSLSRISEQLRLYDRYVLLRDTEIWQTRLHWILPCSVFFSFVTAAVFTLPPVSFVETIPSIDQLVYPLLFISATLMILWSRAQARVVISPTLPRRINIFRTVVIRLSCLACLLLPPLTLSACARHRVQRMQSTHGIARASSAINEAIESCKRSWSQRRPNWFALCRTGGRGVILNLDEEARRKCAYLIGRSGTSHAYIRHVEDEYVGAEEELGLWSSSFDHFAQLPSSRHSLLFFVEPVISRSRAWSETSDFGGPAHPDAVSDAVVSEGVQWVNDRCRHPQVSDLEEQRIDYLKVYFRQANQIAAHGYGPIIPERPVRLICYLLVCSCHLLPFLSVWAGYLRIAKGIVCLAACIFFIGYLSAMGWLSGSEVPLPRVEAWGCLALSFVPFAMIPFIVRFAPSKALLFGATIAAILAPLASIVGYFLETPWAWVGSLTGSHLISEILSGFAYSSDPTVQNAEFTVYTLGLGYCCAFIVWLGPTMHRLRFSPR